MKYDEPLAVLHEERPGKPQRTRLRRRGREMSEQVKLVKNVNAAKDVDVDPEPTGDQEYDDLAQDFLDVAKDMKPGTELSEGAVQAIILMRRVREHYETMERGIFEGYFDAEVEADAEGNYTVDGVTFIRTAKPVEIA